MKYMTRIGYTDRDPFEVVRIISDTCIEVRAMKAEPAHAPEDLDPHPGGFACHFAAQSRQSWTITPDETAPIFRVRQSHAKGKAGRWFDAHKQEYRPSEQPYKFYDYNF